MNSNYSVVIQWSEQENSFVAILPEWGEFGHTLGKTYEEALVNAKTVLELLIQSSLKEGKSLPKPKTFKISSQAA